MSSWDSREAQENQEGRAGLAEPGRGECCGRAWARGCGEPSGTGGTGGTPSLQGRAELPGAGREGAGKAVCDSRVGEWAQISRAAGEKSNGAVITSKGVSSFPVKEFPLFLSRLQHS